MRSESPPGKKPEPRVFQDESPWKLLLLIVLAYVASGIVTAVLQKRFSADFATFMGNSFLLGVAMLLAWANKITLGSFAGAPQPSGKVAALAALGVALLVTSDILGIVFRFATTSDSLDRACSPEPHAWANLLQSLLISPVVEEILISGLLLSLCRKRLGTYKAVGATCVAFASLHLPGDASQFLSRFAYEALACALVIRTGTLTASIAAHMAMNFSLFLVDNMENGCRVLLSNATSAWPWLLAWLISLAVSFVLVQRILAMPLRSSKV